MKRTTSNLFNNRPINTGKYNEYQCIKEYLQKIDSLMANALQKHSKVMMFRMDLRFPVAAHCLVDHATLVSNFIESLTRNLKYNKLDPYYLWTREQEGSINPHYHLMILVDGHKNQKPHKSLNLAQELWSKQFTILNCQGVNNLVYMCDYQCCMINRNSQESINKAFYWASYLAKVNTKTITSSYRSIGHSRVDSQYSLSKFY